MESGLRAGTAKVDITAPFSVPYLGFVPRQAHFEGVHDPLFARALYLKSDGGAAAVIALDMLGVARGLPGGDLRLNVLERVNGSLGLGPESLMFCSSHAHSTPELAGITSLHHLDPTREWLEKLAGDLAKCLTAAAEGALPAEIRFGRGELSDISANRRVLDKQGVLHRLPRDVPPDQLARPALMDPDVNVMRFDFSDGSHSALVNFTCHPTTVQVNPLMSADFPGVATRLVETESPGCRECLFIQGACGDINPIGGSATPDFDAVESNGTALGREALRVLETLKGQAATSGVPVSSSIRELEFPRRRLPDPSPMREQIYDSIADAYRLVGAAQDETPGDGGQGRDEALRVALRDARRMVEQFSEIAKGPAPIWSFAQGIRVGDVAIAGVPGELFSKLGREIKTRSPAPFTICAGYANDYIGYLSDDEAFAEGGYETSLGPWCPVGAGGGAVAVSGALDRLNELYP